MQPDDSPKLDDELFEQPVPAPQVLAKHKGKVIAYDAVGVVHEAADSWGEMMARLGGRADQLTLMYVPAGALIG